MLGSGHWIPGLDGASGMLALMAFSVVAAVAVAVVLIRLVLRGIGYERAAVLLWVSALALLGGLAGYVLIERFAPRDQVAERRALETRMTELAGHALAQGSPLGCLDVGNALVESACEKSLFANAETVAAAVAYVDAKLSLLATSAALAARDQGYRPSHERLRRSLESDRYGLVAHVLTTRGCGSADCPELRLLRNPSNIVAHMKSRAFESTLGTHALAWANGTPAVASASSAPGAGAATAITTGVGHGAPMASAAAPADPKFDFPSASSIPAISIMTPEPAAAPAQAETKAAPAPPKRPASTPTPRRQQAAAPSAPPAHPAPTAASPPPPQPPTQIAPPEPEPAPAPVYDPHTRAR